MITTAGVRVERGEVMSGERFTMRLQETMWCLSCASAPTTASTHVPRVASLRPDKKKVYSSVFLESQAERCFKVRADLTFGVTHTTKWIKIAPIGLGCA